MIIALCFRGEEKKGEHQRVRKNTENNNRNCDRCNGTGNFANGLTCISCKGKGYQTPQDVKEDELYWRNKEILVTKEEEKLKKGIFTEMPSNTISRLKSTRQLIRKARIALNNAADDLDVLLKDAGLGGS